MNGAINERREHYKFFERRTLERYKRAISLSRDDKFHCDSLANYKYFTNMESRERAHIYRSRRDREIRNLAAIKFIG